jgi:hypothetical protein
VQSQASNSPHDSAQVFDVADREFLVGCFASALSRMAGEDWRLRDRIVAHAAVLAATPGRAHSGLRVAIDLDDLGDLCDAVAWAIHRAWSLEEPR